MAIERKRGTREKRTRRSSLASWWRKLFGKSSGISDPKVPIPDLHRIRGRRLQESPPNRRSAPAPDQVRSAESEFTFKTVVDPVPPLPVSPSSEINRPEIVAPGNLDGSPAIADRIDNGKTTGDHDTARQRRKRTAENRTQNISLAASPWLAVAIAGGLAGLFAWGLIHLGREKGFSGQTQEIEFWRVDEPAFIAARSKVLSVPLIRPEAEPNTWKFPLVRMPGLVSRLDGANRLGLQVDMQYFVRSGRTPLAGVWRIEMAEIRDASGRLWFKTSAPVTVRSGDLLELARETTTLLQTFPDRCELRVQGHSDAIPTIRCHVAQDSSLGDLIPNHPGLLVHLMAPEASEKPGRTNFCFPLGRMTTPEVIRPAARAELMAQAWGWKDASVFETWVLAWCGGILAGCLLFPWQPWGGGSSDWKVWLPMALRSGFATGVLFFSLAALQAMWCPPFQGSDEAAHTLSFFELVDDRISRSAAIDLGRKTHAARLWLRPNQRLTPADSTDPHPYFVNHPDGMHTFPDARSALGSRFWSFTTRIPGLDASVPIGTRLLRLRWSHALIVSFAVGLAAALLSAIRRDRLTAPWAFLAVSAVPGVSWYAMNISNYPLIMAGTLFLGALTVAGLSKSRGTSWFGILWGIAVGSILMSSSSSAPVVAGLLVVLFGRPVRSLFLSDPRDFRGVREILIFWAGLWIGLMSMRLFSNAAFDAKSAESFHSILHRLHWDGLGKVPFFAASLGILAGFAGLEIALAAFSRPSLHSPEHSGNGPRVAGFAVLCVVVFWLVATFWPARPLVALRELVPLVDVLPGTGIPRPLLTPAGSEDPQPATVSFIRDFAGAFLRSWSAGDPDYLVSRLFWGTSGLLESALNPLWIRAMASFFVAGLAFSFWRLLGRRQWPQVVDLVFALLGIGAYVTAIALGCKLSVGTPPVQGRYLLGAYLWLLPILAFGWQPVLGSVLRWRPFVVAAVVMGILLGMHWIHLSSVMQRYLG